MGILRQFGRQPQRVWLRKALFQVHLWTGIAAGLYVLLISISGSAVVFRQDIYRAIESRVVIVEGAGERMTLEALKEFVLRQRPGYEVVQVYEDEGNPKRAVELTLERGWSRKQLLFDPYTGQDLGPAIPWPIRAVSWFEELHSTCSEAVQVARSMLPGPGFSWCLPCPARLSGGRGFKTGSGA